MLVSPFLFNCVVNERLEDAFDVLHDRSTELAIDLQLSDPDYADYFM